MTDKELLAVLDLPEDEQIAWVSEYCNKEKIDNTTLIPHPELGCEDYEIEISLADLAFRLRDEACKISCEKYNAGLELVFKHRYPKYYVSFGAFCTYQLKPIDMFIASLLAKQK